MPIDPYIGVNIAGGLTQNRLAALQLRQAQQDAQAQNALREAFSQPDAIDPQTGMPSQNTLMQVMRASPAAGFKLMDTMGQLEETRARRNYLLSETRQKETEAQSEFLYSTISAYDDALKDGKTTPAEAEKTLRSEVSDYIDQQALPADQKQAMKARYLSMSLPQLRALSQASAFGLKERQEGERERHDEAMEGAALGRSEGTGWQILTDPKTNTQYRYNTRTGESTTLDMKPYTPSGAQKMGGPPTAGRSGVGAAITAEQARRAREGLPPMTEAEIDDVAARYTYATRAAGATGTRAGATTFAVKELENMIPPAKQAFAQLSRTDFLPFNKLLNRVESGLGNAAQRRAKVAAMGAVNAYARAVSPTGVPRVSDIERGEDILDTADTPGAFNAAIDQLRVEANAIIAGRDEARADTGGGTPSGPGSDPRKNPDPDDPYQSPDDIAKAFRAGRITREKAARLLRDRSWAR